MKKPPKRLVIKPGRYETRNGNVAIVKGRDKKKTWPVYGSIPDEDRMGVRWTADGLYYEDSDSTEDLIRRLPDQKAKPAKRERMAQVRYRINARLAWLAVPKNQRAIKALIEAAVKHMKKKSKRPMLPATRKET